jgi:cell division inhibitor SulA
VNIWREVEAAGVALVGPDTADGTYQLLSSWLALSVDERARLRQAAEECFASRFEISRAADSLLAELAGVLDHPAQTV